MPAVSLGVMDWSANRDDNGHRTYNVAYKVLCDGPASPGFVLAGVSGIPPVGSAMVFDDASDLWAFRTPAANITPLDAEDDLPYLYRYETTYTSKPRRKEDEQTANPLMEPYQIRGSFMQEREERVIDRDGNPILNSAKELITGPVVERNTAYPTISISINSATLPLGQLKTAMGRVNSVAMWGLPPRTIRLEGAPWERNIVAANFIYYSLTLEFLINEETFDKVIIDRGTRVLRDPQPGEGTVDANDPRNYIAVLDKNDEPVEVFLDGNGRQLTALTDGGGASSIITTQPLVDKEFNFLLFGVPAVL